MRGVTGVVAGVEPPVCSGSPLHRVHSSGPQYTRLKSRVWRATLHAERSLQLRGDGVIDLAEQRALLVRGPLIDLPAVGPVDQTFTEDVFDRGAEQGLREVAELRIVDVLVRVQARGLKQCARNPLQPAVRACSTAAALPG